jgi:hypothetical protein
LLIANYIFYFQLAKEIKEADWKSRGEDEVVFVDPDDDRFGIKLEVQDIGKQNPDAKRKV